MAAQPTAAEYHAATMGQMDWDRERERLANQYAGMENGELQQISVDAESLTDVARQALHSEMLKRGIPVPLQGTRTGVPAAKKVEPPPPVMLRRYRDFPEALIAKSILDSAGIESFLVDDNMVRLDWFYSNLLGGIKLLVRAEDAEAAAELIEQSTPEKFKVEGVGEYKQPRCPRCQSLHVAFRGLDRRLAYSSLFVGVPIPISDRAWKCHSCGHEWEEDDGDAPGSDPTTREPKTPH